MSGDIITHFGMGSGTAIRLACLEALFLINNKRVKEDDIVSCSRRGGTSGVGINSYFHGGLVFDLGVKKEEREFAPSFKVKAPKRPLLLDIIDMPNWKIGLCLPKKIATKTREEESEFFKRACPIASSEAYKILYHSLYGVYSSVREGDIDVFSRSIKEIQKCEWKAKERAEYGAKLLDIEDRLYGLGAACVGMSSLGPLLYFVAADDKYGHIINGLGGDECDIIVASSSNTGRELLY